MRLKFIIVLVGIASLVAASSFPGFRVAKARGFTSIWFDSFSGPSVFEGFDGSLESRWMKYRGTPTIVGVIGRPSVLRLTHPDAGDPWGSFGSPAGASLFLINPATSDFSDGMIEFDLYFETSGWSGVSAMLTFRMQSDNTYYALRLTSTRDWYSSFVIYSSGVPRDIGIPSDKGAFPTGAWSHVTVTIGGTRMTCYMDGVPICSADDGSWSQGSWGGVGLQNNYYDGAFYIDNFKIPGRLGWNSYRGSPRIDWAFGKSGSSMLFDHPSWLGDDASFGSMHGCSAYISDPDLRLFQNGVIEFDMYFDNAGGQKAFMTFRMESDSSYYAARLTCTADWPSYFVRRTGADFSYPFGAKSSNGAMTANVWFHVTIVIEGNHFEMWKEGERLFSGDEWSLVRGTWGGIGFYSAYYGTTFHIDNLKLCIPA